MERQRIKGSGNIRSMGHEGDTLEVEFSTGDVYRYSGVPAEVHREVADADSVGSAFARLIRKGGYEFTKLDPEE